MSGGRKAGTPWRRLTAALLIALASALAGLAISLWPALAVFENKSLDLRFRLRGSRDRSGSGIVVIYVDDASLEFYKEALGRWPWPREIWGRVLDYLAAGKPRAVAFDIFFSEPDLANPASDAFLARATREAGNVYHSFTLEREPNPAPPGIGRHVAGVEGTPPGDYPGYAGAVYPLPELVAAARGLGVINYNADWDGPSRRAALLYRLNGAWYPSLPLAAAAAGLGADSFAAIPGGLKVGARKVPLDGRGGFLINWRGPPLLYPRYSVGEVIDSILRRRDGQAPTVPASVFRDKIVLIGTSAVSLYDLRVNPFSPKMPGVDLNAAVIDNILHGDFLRWAGTGWLVTLSLGLALAVSLSVILARGQAVKLLAPSAAMAALPVAAYILFSRWSLWLPLVSPLAAGFLALTVSYVYNYATEGREKRRIKAALSRCVSHQVADEIARDPDIIRLGEGIRQEVTVLFSDIRGFTSLSEKLPAEEVVRLLTRYFTAMVDIVFKHGGTLDKFVGDAIMAVFGAPKRSPGQAETACRCALEMIAVLKEVNAGFTRDGLPNIAIGVGVNTGEAIAGFMGSEKRLEYTVIGDTVNLASRLEGLTKEYQTPIIISEFTLREVAEKVDVKELAVVKVKGKEQPVRIYGLLGMK